MERHPLSISYLVAGIVFIAVAVVGLADVRVLRLAELAWAGPGLLVLLGIGLVVGTATRRGDRGDEATPRATGPSDDSDTTTVDETVEDRAPAS